MKPLTKAEALRHARNDPKLASLLRGGGEVVLVEPERARSDGHAVIVAVHDHEQGRSLVALVDSTGVVGVHETPARFQLSAAERTTAEQLVAADARAKAFLRRRRMNPLTRLYFPPDARPGHRHAIVFLRPNSSERRYAVVDLKQRQVVELLDEADLTRGASS